jgi:lactate dehydrogenase-like 2-hydroxyacid dehydrogenase
MLARMDIISVNCPHTPATFHLLSARRLKLIRKDAYIVNTARGEVIDEDTLVKLIEAGEIGGAGLDVYENEPAVAPGLAALDTIVLVPHLGSASAWTREGMATLAAANVAAILEGWPVWGAARGLADVLPFLEDGEPPHAAPSIANADALGLPFYAGQAPTKEEQQ